MNPIMEELEDTRQLLEGRPRPLSTMRVILELQAIAAGYHLHEKSEV